MKRLPRFLRKLVLGFTHVQMNDRQRESAAKFLYDIAKGVALIAVVSPWVTGHLSWLTLFLGGLTAVVFFCWAFWLERTQGGTHDGD